MPVAKDVHTTTSAASTTIHSERARLAATDRSVSPSPASWESDAEIHLIRLCLDLQLDAMMLTFGAASAQSRQSSPSTASASGPAGHAASPPGQAAPPGAPPWRRWVLEDVDVVCTLAADVMSGGAALPPTLGSDLDHKVPAAAIDNLIARYASMVTLLADVLPPDGSRPHTPYRVHAQEALAHCQDRLRELRNTRLDHTPPRGLQLTAPTEHPPVPGEWLG